MHYTTFTEKEIYPIATIMLEYLLSNPIQHETLYTKYAHRKYMKVSLLFSVSSRYVRAV